ncbi:MAG: hypothetical protein ACLT0Y_06330 [Christensenellales bacterium]
MPQQGRTAAGVKAIVLEAGDEVLFADLLHEQKRWRCLQTAAMQSVPSRR